MICGVAAIFFGLLITLGPQFLFKTCDTPGDNLLRCHWAARAEICTGILIAALGICLTVFSDPKTRLGLTIGIFLAGIVSVIIPLEQFIGICKEADALCRKVTFPALLTLSAMTIIGAVANMFYLERKTKT